MELYLPSQQTFARLSKSLHGYERIRYLLRNPSDIPKVPQSYSDSDYIVEDRQVSDNSCFLQEIFSGVSHDGALSRIMTIFSLKFYTFYLSQWRTSVRERKRNQTIQRRNQISTRRRNRSTPKKSKNVLLSGRTIKYSTDYKQKRRNQESVPI